MSKRSSAYGSYGRAMWPEEKKKAHREVMEEVSSRPTASAGSSSSTSQSMPLPGHGKPAAGEMAVSALSRPTASAGSSSSTSQSMPLPGHGEPAAGEMVVSANARRAASMPIGKERDGQPMDARLCHAAFRDELVRSVRSGVITLITAYATQSLRKPPGTEGGPAREGVALGRPDQKLNVSGEAGDAGHVCYHIVFRSLLLVADIVDELQQKGIIASKVDVKFPEHYRWYGENTAEDSIEAGLGYANSTWSSPGMVYPKAGARDAIKSLSGSHLLQLIAKTQDCMAVCWPEEGAPWTHSSESADRVARYFMDTFFRIRHAGQRAVCPAGLDSPGDVHLGWDSAKPQTRFAQASASNLIAFGSAASSVRLEAVEGHRTWLRPT